MQEYLYLRTTIDPSVHSSVTLSYLSNIQYAAVNAWTEDSKDSLTPCGHCDNCTRDPSTVENKDVTLDAWRILQHMKAFDASKVKVSMGELVTASRGLGGANSKTKRLKTNTGQAAGDIDKVEMSEKVSYSREPDWVSIMTCGILF